MLVFEESGKQEYPEKNLSELRREPTTNSTHILRRVRESIPSHIGGRRVLSPLRHSCSLMRIKTFFFRSVSFRSHYIKNWAQQLLTHTITLKILDPATFHLPTQRAQFVSSSVKVYCFPVPFLKKKNRGQNKFLN